MPQEQPEAAALLRGERQPSRGGQVRGPPALGQFAGDGCHSARLQRLFHGEERVPDRGRPDKKETRRIEPEQRAAFAVQDTRFERGIILLDPDDGPRNRKDAKPQAESGHGAEVAWGGRGQFVQLAETEAALQHTVDGRETESHAAGRR